MKVYLYLLTGHYRDPEKLTLVKILPLHQLQPVSSGSYPQALEQAVFKGETVTLVFIRIRQVSLFISILVSPWLFKKTSNNLLKYLSEFPHHWEGSSFEGRYKGVQVRVEGLDKTFEDNLFSSAWLIANETLIYGPVF